MTPAYSHSQPDLTPYPVSAAPVTGAPEQAPPQPVPLRRKPGIGWIIGGVSGTLAILLAIAATLVGTGVFGPRSGATGSAGQADVKAEYRFVADLCSKLDVKALEKLAPLDGPAEKDTEERAAKESISVCNAKFADAEVGVTGSLYASATIAKSEGTAAADAEEVREPKTLDGEMMISDLKGDWDFGNIATRFHPSTGSLRISVLIQDTNFTAIAEAVFTKADGEIPEAELQEATIATAMGTLELSRA